MDLSIWNEYVTVRQSAHFSGNCLMNVYCGSTGPKGGDAGHGAMTEVVVTLDAGGPFEIEVDGQKLEFAEKLVLKGFGDCEIKALQKAFKFVADNI